MRGYYWKCCTTLLAWLLFVGVLHQQHPSSKVGVVEALRRGGGSTRRGGGRSRGPRGRHLHVMTLEEEMEEEKKQQEQQEDHRAQVLEETLQEHHFPKEEKEIVKGHLGVHGQTDTDELVQEFLGMAKSTKKKNAMGGPKTAVDDDFGDSDSDDGGEGENEGDFSETGFGADNIDTDKGKKGSMAPVVAASAPPTAAPVVNIPAVEDIATLEPEASEDTTDTTAQLAERTLSLAVFEYTFPPNTEDPTMQDAEELSLITTSLLQTMYTDHYEDQSDVLFYRADISSHKFLRPNLLQFSVHTYFVVQATIPNLQSVEAVAQQGLDENGLFHNKYLDHLQNINSNVFSKAVAFRYISTEQQLNEILNSESPTKASIPTVTAAPSPMDDSTSTSSKSGGKENKPGIRILSIIGAVFISLTFLAWFVWRVTWRRGGTATMDRNHNLMSHKRDPDDDMEACMSVSYRTREFSDDEIEDDRRVLAAKKSKSPSKSFDLDEVSLGSMSSTSRVSDNFDYEKGSVYTDQHNNTKGVSNLEVSDAFRLNESVKPEWASRSTSASAARYNEALKKHHDESAKPEWAARSSLKPVPKDVSEQIQAKAVPSSKVLGFDKFPATEKKFISASPRLIMSPQRSEEKIIEFPSSLEIPQIQDALSEKDVGNQFKECQTPKEHIVEHQDLNLSPLSPEQQLVDSAVQSLIMPQLQDELKLTLSVGSNTDAETANTKDHSDEMVKKDQHVVAQDQNTETVEASLDQLNAEVRSAMVDLEQTIGSKDQEDNTEEPTLNQSEETTEEEAQNNSRTAQEVKEIKNEVDDIQEVLAATYENNTVDSTEQEVQDGDGKEGSNVGTKFNELKNDWMKTELRATSPPVVGPGETEDEEEPEWMRKFKEMGLEKND